MKQSSTTAFVRAVLVCLTLSSAVLVLARAQSSQTDTVASAALLRLFNEDQTDRRRTSEPTEAEWAQIVARDSVRRDSVVALVLAGGPESAEDYYHAAMVLQHAKDPADVLTAHILATVAGFKGHAMGRWLSAAALDRYLQRTEQPQRLGTQYLQPNAAGPWTQAPYVDSLPDSIRKEFGVKSLEEQARTLKGLNGNGRGYRTGTGAIR